MSPSLSIVAIAVLHLLPRQLLPRLHLGLQQQRLLSLRQFRPLFLLLQPPLLLLVEAPSTSIAHLGLPFSLAHASELTAAAEVTLGCSHKALGYHRFMSTYDV